MTTHVETQELQDDDEDWVDFQSFSIIDDDDDDNNNKSIEKENKEEHSFRQQQQEKEQNSNKDNDKESNNNNNNSNQSNEQHNNHTFNDKQQRVDTSVTSNNETIHIRTPSTRSHNNPNNPTHHKVLKNNNNNNKQRRKKKKTYYNLVANESPSLLSTRNKDDEENQIVYNTPNVKNTHSNNDDVVTDRIITNSPPIRSQLFPSTYSTNNDKDNNNNNNDNDSDEQLKENDHVVPNNKNEEEEKDDDDDEDGMMCNNSNYNYYTKEEERLIEQFWKWYDDVIFLSVFSILGVLFRLASAKYVSIFGGDNDETSSDDDAELFTTLPLNCFSCFLMGLLCSGEDVMAIIPRAWYFKKFHSPPPPPNNNNNNNNNQQTNDDNDDIDNMNKNHPYYDDENDMENDGKNNDEKIFQRLLGKEEQREVQLAALERRIQESKSLVLFPAKKQHVDVMEHYNYNVPNNANRYNNHQLEEGRRTSHHHRRRNKEFLKTTHSKWSYETGLTTETTKESLVIPEGDFQKANEQVVDKEDGGPNNNSNNNNNSHTIGNDNDGLGVEEEEEQQQQQQGDAALFVDNLKGWITRVNVADGWDVGTTPDDMSDDLLLGLRVGFCGALSTFASWNSDMVTLMKQGKIRLTLTGYVLGLALPMFCYRLGQHVALYIFIWRCNNETRRAEKRGGYGIRVIQNSSDDEDDDEDDEYYDDDSISDSTGSIHKVPENKKDNNSDSDHLTGINITTYSSENPTSPLESSVVTNEFNTNNGRQQQQRRRRNKRRRKVQNDGTVATSTTAEEALLNQTTPSVRAIATAIALMILVLLFSALIFFQGKTSVQRYCIALLFSPFGVLARWKISQKWNNQKFMIYFPLGTFICNILGCALSGSLGSLLAGNPGPEESIVLVSMISGFAGSLSTLASFLVEVLNRIDPVLFQLDGVQYLLITVFWGMVVGLVTNQATNWADEL